MNAAMLVAEPLVRLRDNPLLLAQARRRLRKANVMPGVIITGLLGLFGSALVSLAKEDAAWVGFRWFLMVIMAGQLFVRATSLLVTTMALERESGILDFHRATPTSPWTQALGYVLGVTSREWVLCGVMLPFFLLGSVITGNVVVDVVSLGMLAMSAVVYQVFAAWLGLCGGTDRRSTATMTFFVIAALIGAEVANSVGLHTLAHLSPLRAIQQLQGHDAKEWPQLFGLMVPPLVLTLIMHAHALTFGAWALARKLTRDTNSSFSRSGALWFLGSVLLLALGGTWTTLGESGQSGLVALLGGFTLGGGTVLTLVLLTMVGPSYLAFMRALRRARSAGHKAPSMLEDGGALLPLTLSFFGVLVVAMVVLMVQGSHAVPLDLLFSPSTALAFGGALGLLLTGSGIMEYTQLTLRGAWRGGAMLWVFVLLFVPPMLASVWWAADHENPLVVYLASLSPLGVMLSFMDMARHWSHAAQERLIIPAALATCSSLAAGIYLHVRVAAFRRDAGVTASTTRP